jgi:hypothetical protein
MTDLSFEVSDNGNVSPISVRVSPPDDGLTETQPIAVAEMFREPKHRALRPSSLA